MFFIVLWMLCFNCNAAVFLPKVHSVDMEPFDTEDIKYDDFRSLIRTGCIDLSENSMQDFLLYGRSKNINLEEKINYYLCFIQRSYNMLTNRSKVDIPELKNIANGILYDQGRYEQLKKWINSNSMNDIDRVYCNHLFTVLDFLMNISFNLLSEIKIILPKGQERLKAQNYKALVWNIFDFIEDTLPFKRKTFSCALM